ncbi:MAG: hypothetical protein Kow00127_14870 [Bacteroidales bacterium]
MKKFIFVVLFSILSGWGLQAQTTLDTALNFSVKDVMGNTIKLYDLLDAGKIVMIDFFSVA